jgi:putative hydrolase of the HAD superfamily
LQAVVFDLGGTLIDYLGGAPSWPEMEYPGVQALHDCLSAAGFPVDAEAFRESFIRSMDARWRAATEAMSDPPTLGSLIVEACHAAGFNLEGELHQTAVAAYCAPIAAAAVVAPGAAALLAWLRAHGVRIGLISNTIWPGDVHRLDLERYELLPYFDTMIFSSETTLWKPDPRIFALALERLGAKAERAAFVGDRLLEDVQGAQRAGLRAVFVEGTQDYADIPVDAFIPDARIQRLADLPAALASIWED